MTEWPTSVQITVGERRVSSRQASRWPGNFRQSPIPRLAVAFGEFRFEEAVLQLAPITVSNF